MRRSTSFVVAVLLLCPRVLATQPDPLREARANDNLIQAGVRKGSVVSLRLVVQEATWHPELAGPPVRVQAFATEGGGPEIPGPLLRVRQGDRVDVTVRNSLAMPVTVYGFGDRANASENLTIAAGEQGHARFTLTAPGTFFYWAKTVAKSLEERGGIALWGAKLFAAGGIPVAAWPYGSVMNIGIIMGALLASLLAGKFAPTWKVPGRSLAAGVIGGFLLDYGARVAYGCDIGAYFSGIASGSLHRWCGYPPRLQGAPSERYGARSLASAPSAPRTADN